LISNSNEEANLQTYKALLESNAHGTRLLASAESNQRGCPQGVF